MNGHLHEVITLKAESSTHFGYDNHPIAKINDHVVRIATMGRTLSLAFSSKLRRDISSD